MEMLGPVAQQCAVASIADVQCDSVLFVLFVEVEGQHNMILIP